MPIVTTPTTTTTTTTTGRNNRTGGTTPQPQTPSTTPVETPNGSAWGNSGQVGTAVQPGGVIHTKSPVVLEGAKFKPEALARLNNLKMENYGQTRISIPTAAGGSKTFVVRDMLYDLGDGKVGARLIPVKDHDAASSAAMDKLIREKSGLTTRDPIFALVAYVHPEEHKATLKEAATQMLKTEMGNTHLGAYLGKARTSNSPENYHQKSWGVGEGQPYPANVQIVSLDGVKQGLLNKNMLNADSVLNKGVLFPSDYKNDPFKTVDINTTLMFYRDWIKGEAYLKDNEWQTYCAEHKTIVTNIGLNVPHNAAAFKEIFGDEGPALWTAYKAKFKEANGRDFKASDETKFEPLWKKEGLTAEQIRPPSKRQYDAYQKARFDGSLANNTYRGYQPQPLGKALAWKPETTADLVKNFLETYSPFDEVGGFTSIASLMAFKEQVQSRMGVTGDVFMENAMPIMGKIMIAEGMARAPKDEAKFKEWQDGAVKQMYVALGGKPEDLAGRPVADIMKLAKGIVSATDQAKASILEKAQIPQARRENAAYVWMRDAIQGDLEKARSVRVASPELTEAYSPPAVTNRVINGLVEKSKFVNIRAIATAVPVESVQ